jgi:Iron/manganese superoxide dismutases, alpha-hairpin domain
MKCFDCSVTAVFFIGSCLLSATGYFHPSTSHHYSSSRTYCTKLRSGSESTPVNPRSAGLNALGRALNIAAAGLAVGSLSFLSTSNAADSTPKISLSPLPYSYTALAPFISEATLKTHHDKHHAKYVSTTLSMIKGTDLENADLVSVMKSAHVVAPVLFNNAAQSWNHDFYWKCMKSGGGGAPTGNIGTLIDKNFGSYEAFKKQVRLIILLPALTPTSLLNVSGLISSHRKVCNSRQYCFR